MRYSRTSTLLPPVLIVLGVTFRLTAFLADRSLSLDEAAMARNIIDHPWGKLLHPLDYAQVAPPGFLIVEKGIASVFGTQEYALRLFPLLCGMASVWLCWAVARRMLSRGPAILALALFAINNAFIDYSVQVKQYAADVCAALVVLLIATVWLGTAGRRRPLWLGLAGAATVVFSFTAVFVLSGTALTCALVALRSPEVRARRTMLVAPAFWVVGAAGGALMGLLSLTLTDAAYMKWFWATGFMPMSLSSATVWLWRKLQSVFSFTGEYRVAIFWVAMVALGTWSLVRRGRAATLSTLLMPLLLVIAAAAARLYPFTSGRTQLFLLPALLILVAEGAGLCWRLSSRHTRWPGILPAAAVLALGIYSTWGGLKGREEYDVRSVLQHIKSHWRSGDRIYVYYGAGQQFLYYSSRYDFAPDDYIVGTCSGANGRAFLHELDQLRGQARVWFVMARYAVDPEVLVGYLDAIGTRRESVSIKPPATDEYLRSTFGYLYDLTNSARSASVSADQFALPEDLSRNEPYRWTCYGVFTPRGIGPSN